MKTITIDEAKNKLAKTAEDVMFINDIFNQHEALQAENDELKLSLDAKDIPRKMSDGVDHRIRCLAKQVDTLQAENEALKKNEIALRVRNNLQDAELIDIQSKLSEYENRSCEGCKHRFMIDDEIAECEIHIIDCAIIGGCNKYEPKDKN